MSCNPSSCIMPAQPAGAVLQAHGVGGGSNTVRSCDSDFSDERERKRHKGAVQLPEASSQAGGPAALPHGSTAAVQDGAPQPTRATDSHVRRSRDGQEEEGHRRERERDRHHRDRDRDRDRQRDRERDRERHVSRHRVRDRHRDRDRDKDRDRHRDRYRERQRDRPREREREGMAEPAIPSRQPDDASEDGLDTARRLPAVERPSSQPPEPAAAQPEAGAAAKGQPHASRLRNGGEFLQPQPCNLQP